MSESPYRLRIERLETVRANLNTSERLINSLVVDGHIALYETREALESVRQAGHKVQDMITDFQARHVQWELSHHGVSEPS